MRRSSRPTRGRRSALAKKPLRVRQWRRPCTLSSTVMLPNSARFWKVRPMPSAAISNLAMALSLPRFVQLLVALLSAAFSRSASAVDAARSAPAAPMLAAWQPERRRGAVAASAASFESPLRIVPACCSRAPSPSVAVPLRFCASSPRRELAPRTLVPVGSDAPSRDDRPTPWPDEPQLLLALESARLLECALTLTCSLSLHLRSTSGGQCLGSRLSLARARSAAAAASLARRNAAASRSRASAARTART